MALSVEKQIEVDRHAEPRVATISPAHYLMSSGDGTKSAQANEDSQVVQRTCGLA